LPCSGCKTLSRGRSRTVDRRYPEGIWYIAGN
jgi:hypothetical protein